MSITTGIYKIKRARIRFVVALVFLLAVVGMYYTTPWSVSTREFLVIAGVAYYAFATIQVVFSRCPQCGRLFHNVLGFKNPFSNTCSHCGLALELEDSGR